MVAFNGHKPDNDRPPDHILEWCRELVAKIADGGVWGIPRSNTFFRVNRKNKQLILTKPGDDDGDDFRATRHVFSYIGWRVITGENEEPTTNEQ